MKRKNLSIKKKKNNTINFILNIRNIMNIIIKNFL